MPFTSVDEIPAATRARLTEAEQRQWIAVWNSVFEDTGDESVAFATANAAVKKGGDTLEEVSWQADIEITKVEEDQRLVFGYLSVAKTKDGEVLVDKQGDIIPEEELEKAAYDFNLFARRAGNMHLQTRGIGRLVESAVFTEEKQKALGIPKGILPVGWWVGFKIDDDKTWEMVKSGELSAFSIGGKAQREEVEINA